MDRSGKVVLFLLFLSIVAVFATATWLFLFEKNYDFVVEATCDPATETCFTRDCSNLDDCPPNELEEYRIFRVRAGDFEKCADNSCLAECTAGSIQCEEVICGESEEDECAEIPPPETEEIPLETEEEAGIKEEPTAIE